MASGRLELDLSMGMLLIGLAATASLFGVTFSQAMWYYRRYPRDRKILQLLVTTVWGMDALSLVLYSSSLWDYLVRKNLHYFGGLSIPWMSNAQIVVNAIAIAIIQSFYTYRIWTLTRQKVLTGFLLAFVSADFALALLLFFKSINTQSLADYIRLTPFDIAMSCTTATTDIILCGTLVTLLARSRTGSAGSDRLINRLLFYTINTGLVTSMCALTSLITVLVLPEASVYVLFYYIGARMYTVSLLATLNAREHLRIQAEQLGDASIPRLTRTSNSVSRRSVRAVVDAMSPSKEIVVAIQRDTTVTFEERSEEDLHDARRRGPYRYQSQSPTEPRSPKLVALLTNNSLSPPKRRDSIGTSSLPDSQLASSSSSGSGTRVQAPSDWS
ncbi:hypothetical protein BD309DRAFT_968037 [Dichomitus squalens]|uniref:Uncharacterized protein n=1 Tax=Dichomitus squalens TaxID=114155 RepID=A0A4Q9PMT9_9APHY|nr:uncharacterized protein DICSQDRAFT_178182 [Dichomitus squalens LYAD-421 SS1]EJF64530.1 hypothetical protein DICSQDRAFT_178182 [Dichomitus squalens LYAD-421 SS1]TBU40159.1 hypothetical protein BD309DRAFT_968037 [Dichomitus squalens]TBU55567.1 hypothetical protein BD310DRAFT_933371 [Dichomitus squalens]